MQFSVGKLSQKLPLFFRQYIWIILGLLSLLLREWANDYPDIVEKYYSRGLFPLIRGCFENSLGLFPIAWIYFFYAIAFATLIRIIYRLFLKKDTFIIRLKRFLLSLLSFSGFLLFWFFILWGFNYARLPITRQMGIKMQKLDSLSLEKEFIIAANDVINARKNLGNTPLSIDTFLIDFEHNIRQDVIQFLSKNNFPTSKGLRGRSLQPNGILFGFGISGIYMPYVGESNIDNGLHPLEKPFTMAHELAHGYGWTEEATANFIAYLACTQSKDAFTRYSGYLMYYRYVANNYRRMKPEAYNQFRENLPKAITDDLRAINDRLNSFKTWWDTEGVNNVFLTWQGLKGGVMSYSRVVVLVFSWRKSSI